MTKKLSDKLGDVFVTTNPQSSGLAGEIIYYSGDTSEWEENIDGVIQQDGWALCNGAVVEQDEYFDLFTAIDTTWNFSEEGPTQFRLPTIPAVVGGTAEEPRNAVAIVALYNNLASVVSTRDLSVNKLSIDEDLTVGTTAVIPDLTVTGTLTADAVVSNSGETVSDILGEIKASVLTEAQFQSLKGTGWVLANGDEISREVYADLFALIGEIYGPGDGVNTFNLPDLRQKYIRGASGEGMTMNDLGASNDDTTRVDNVTVVADSSIKSFSGAQTMNGAGAQTLNAAISSLSNNAGNTNNAGSKNINSSANSGSFSNSDAVVTLRNISANAIFNSTGYASDRTGNNFTVPVTGTGPTINVSTNNVPNPVSYTHLTLPTICSV